MLCTVVCLVYPGVSHSNRGQKACLSRIRGRSDRDLPSCWLRRLAAVVSGKHLAWAVPLRTMVILSLIEAIFEIQSW